MEHLLLNVWSTVGSVALAILILLVMITIHEFGHYVAGKLLGFRIDEFSIGFGPALFKRRSKKTGELFAFRLIPLGGYCAFAGEDGLDEEDEKEKDGTSEQDGHRNAEKNGEGSGQNTPSPEPFAQFQEDAAHNPSSDGAALPADTGNAADAVRVTTDADAGNAADTGDAASDVSDASSAAHDMHETAVQPTVTRAEGNGAKDAPRDQDAEAKEPPVRTGGEFTKMAPWKRIIVLIAGAFMNYVLAVFLLIVCFFAYGQTMIAVYKAEPTAEIPAQYCLQDYDILLEAQGKKLYLTTDVAQALNGHKAGDLVEMRISRVVGTREDGTYLREEMDVRIALRADVEVKNSADLDGVWRALGIAYETEGESGVWQLANASYRFGFWETLGRSFAYSFKIAGSIFKVLGELLTGRLGISALGGPITTITLTSQIAGRSFRGFLEIAGFLGVNLAVFNLLPIPALDGSKVVFTVIEWIRKKPLNRKVEAIIHAVGFLLLLGFAVLVDILQFV